MATRARITERAPVEGVELEYALATGSKRSTKPRFKRGRLLSITNETIDLGAREAFHAGDMLAITLHTKRVTNLFTINAEIEACARVTVLRQPAFCVTLRFVDPDESQKRKIAWAVDQYTSKEAPQRLQRPASSGAVPEEQDSAKPEPAAAPPKTPSPASSENGIKRPVALLQLIQALEDFEVTNDLILAVIEAAEAGMDVDALFPVSQTAHTTVKQQKEEAEEVAETAPPSQAKPINIYRLAANTTLHFAASGLPAGPATGMFYYSGLKSPETCFAIQLELDIMTQHGHPTFPPGSILIFSVTAPVEDADLAYMKVRGNDLFAQMFTGEKDAVRIRFFNPKYPEVTVKRREIRVMCKLIGTYQSSD